MKRMKRKGMLAMLLAGVMTVLCACSSGMSAADAKSYAQAVMDASYKGEFEDYMEWTDSTEEEAEALYEGSLDTTMSEAGFGDLGISEELVANYRQLFRDMISSAEYTVGEAAEDGEDGYAVDIEVTPFTAFDGIQEEVNTVLTEEVQNMNGIPSNEELNELIFQRMYELMAKRLEAPTYGDPVTVTIHVLPDEDGVYYIPDAELVAVDNAMFPADNF